MSNSRRRARETSNDNLGSPFRVVVPRRSIFAEDSDTMNHSDHVEETEPSEELRPNRSRSSTAVPPSYFSSPIRPSSPIVPRFTSNTRRRIDPEEWDWMPRVLGLWRREERIPRLPEPPTPIPPLTREPVHRTIPVLISRMTNHEDRLNRIDRELNERADLPTGEVELLQRKASGMENDIAELRDLMVAAHNEGVEEVMLLRQQLEESQSHISEMREELAAIRTERAQLRADDEASASMTNVLGNMDQYLR